MTLRAAVVILSCSLIFVGATSFVVSPGASVPKQAEFDRTVAMGLTLEEQRALDDRIVPRAQIAYSQYPYVVGDRGIGFAATMVDDPLVRQEFGYPQAVYDEIASSVLTYVVESDVMGGMAPALHQFSDATEAEEFATEYGRTTISFEESDRIAIERLQNSGAGHGE